MSGQRPLEVITPPNMLRVKVGGRVGLNSAAVERAEAALRDMADDLAQWLQTEIADLETARDAVRRDGLSGAALADLHRRAHDLKGLGATYGYPIVTHIAGLLARLLESRAVTHPAAQILAGAHVDAIRAAVRDEIRDSAHPIGKALTDELGRQVDEITAAA